MRVHYQLHREIIDMIKKVDPEWKLALAGNYHPEIEKDLYDYCLYIGATFPDSVLNRRKRAGKTQALFTLVVVRVFLMDSLFHHRQNMSGLAGM